MDLAGGGRMFMGQSFEDAFEAVGPEEDGVEGGVIKFL